MPSHKLTRKQRRARAEAEAMAVQKRKAARNGKMALVVMPIFIVAGVLLLVRGITGGDLNIWGIIGCLLIGTAATLFGGFFLVSTLLWPPWKDHVGNQIVEQMRKDGRL